MWCECDNTKTVPVYSVQVETNERKRMLMELKVPGSGNKGFNHKKGSQTTCIDCGKDISLPGQK